MIAEALCREVAHPLRVGRQGVGAVVQVAGQGEGVGKYAVAVAADDDALDQRVGGIVQQLDVDILGPADGRMGDGIHQMGTEPHRVARHIVGTVVVYVDDLLRHAGIVVQDALLDVQRVALAVQQLEGLVQLLLLEGVAGLLQHLPQAGTQLLVLGLRQPASVVVTQLAHDDGDGAVVVRRLTGVLLLQVLHLGQQFLKGRRLLGAAAKG